MIIYPHQSPIIMTDPIFIEYGGHVGDSLPAQRTAAYLIAEMAASEDLDTYLLPTIVTGTYANVRNMSRLMLDHGYIQRILVTQFLDSEETIYWAQTGTANIYISLDNDLRGVMNISYVYASCNCHTYGEYPSQIRIMYEAGLPTGTASRADVLAALTVYSDLVLQEFIGYGNEAPGDIGVQAFSNQQYSETRVKLLRTSFGTSARAQFAHRLLTKYRKHRWVGLGQ